ncbi:MAG: hypothetical protein QXF55_00590 [Candidatus Aenigmatarchaeota archaeon]
MFEKNISRGIIQPVHELRGHKRAEFIKRMLMMSSDIVPAANCHVSIHEISGVPKDAPPYAGIHAHKCDEVYLVLGCKETGKKLRYKFVLGDEHYEVESPAAVFVPKRLPHKAEALGGHGTLVAILMSGNRQSTLIFE